MCFVTILFTHMIATKCANCIFLLRYQFYLFRIHLCCMWSIFIHIVQSDLQNFKQQINHELLVSNCFQVELQPKNKKHIIIGYMLSSNMSILRYWQLVLITLSHDKYIISWEIKCIRPNKPFTMEKYDRFCVICCIKTYVLPSIYYLVFRPLGRCLFYLLNALDQCKFVMILPSVELSIEKEKKEVAKVNMYCALWWHYVLLCIIAKFFSASITQSSIN